MATQTEKTLAWLVHVFTASGLLAAFMALIAIDQGQWRASFIWLFICFIIDALDGSLARRFRVEEVLPHMDGKSIDYVIDFATYAIIPAFFFYKAEMVTPSAMPIAIGLILLSSALYYGKKNMVEDEQYFMGFPVLWNFVVFFQFFLVQNHQLTNLISVIIISVLHFVPIRFAYPSMSKRYFKSHLLFSIIGLSGALYVLYIYPIRLPIVEYLAIIGGSYFALFAIYDTLKR